MRGWIPRNGSYEADRLLLCAGWRLVQNRAVILEHDFVRFLHEEERGN